MIELECGDFRDLIQQIPNESVALILTDPPYPKAYHPLITPMGEQASRVLTPDGHLIAYAGNYCVPDWTYRLADAGLRYRATIRLHNRLISTGTC